MLGFVFDLDDTLYAEQSYNFSGFDAVSEHVLQREGIAGLADVCKELYSAGARSNVFDVATLRLNVKLPVAELVEVYRAHRPRIELFEDARWILDTVHGRHPIGLITDGYAGVQRKKVAALGIAPLFDTVVFSDDFGRHAWKPSETPYREVMRRLADRADRFVYIGDNPKKDFVSARALGWLTVMVDRPTNVHRSDGLPAEHLAHHRITTLRDIPWNWLGTTP